MQAHGTSPAPHGTPCHPPCPSWQGGAIPFQLGTGGTQDLLISPPWSPAAEDAPGLGHPKDEDHEHGMPPARVPPETTATAQHPDPARSRLLPMDKPPAKCLASSLTPNLSPRSPQKHCSLILQELKPSLRGPKASASLIWKMPAGMQQGAGTQQLPGARSRSGNGPGVNAT